MERAIKKLRRRVRRRWYLRFNSFNKQLAKQIARWQCYPCTEQLISIFQLKNIESINSVTIDDIDDVIDEEISCWST
ncbi:hypothetical protein RHO12_01700 [Orbus sturtevantii]|uniref:hypothetical protein n=1 Tax=Orbus sturtevantii TaxID=3074109 RepID=UPI00370D4847